MLPRELMSSAVSFAVGLNPVVAVEAMIRKILFFDLGPSQMLGSISYMFLLIVGLSLLLYYTVHKHRHTY
ncbi:MAG: hypothetical protein ACI8Y7_001051 [Candidatus Woesearchaeota archaeon]|jgi:hypothetical protein